jgi:Restriction Enzyme Adenine Methylase Associated
MAKRKPLVSQHLENISREALEKYQNIVRRYVRRRQGVYALYRRGKLYYVGLASNLRSRLSHHLRDRHRDSWERFSVYLTIGDSHLKELESLILRIVKPPANKQVGKFISSQDIRRLFAKDVRARQRDELISLLGRGILNEEAAHKLSLAENHPVLAKYISGPIKLRAKFKGKVIKANARKDGLIRYGGKTYTSPSLAAAKACKRQTCNGWTFWHYERAPGDWVSLNELRR